MGWLRKKDKGRNHYVPGDHNVIDDLHGFKLKRSECRMRWDNVLVPVGDFEERHPQDFLRSRRDKIKVRDARPEQDNVFEAASVSASDL